MSKQDPNKFEIGGVTYVGNPIISFQVLDAFSSIYGVDLSAPDQKKVESLKMVSDAKSMKSFTDFVAIICREEGEKFEIIKDNDGNFVKVDFLTASLKEKADNLYGNVGAHNLKLVTDFFTHGWVPNMLKSAASSKEELNKARKNFLANKKN